MQHSARGGVVAASNSSGLASEERFNIQAWASLSTEMSTICCMLHLLGNRLGQKGSTLYTGAFCECAPGAAAKNPMQESAIATTQVLVHPIRIGIDHSPFPAFSFFTLNNLAGTMAAS